MSLPSIAQPAGDSSSRPTSPSSASVRSARVRRCCKDGFITAEENEALRKAGAVGEIIGWAFDSQGRSDRRACSTSACASAPLRQPAKRPMIGVAMGVGAPRGDPRRADRPADHRA